METLHNYHNFHEDWHHISDIIHDLIQKLQNVENPFRHKSAFFFEQDWFCIYLFEGRKTC